MKLNELLRLLNRFREKHGNCEVYTNDFDKPEKMIKLKKDMVVPKVDHKTSESIVHIGDYK